MPNLNGCRYEEETYSYYALIDGKVEASLSKIEVTGLLEINRNINVVYGSIFFIGDVNIYGDVDSDSVSALCQSASKGQISEGIFRYGVGGCRRCCGLLFVSYYEAG